MSWCCWCLPAEDARLDFANALYSRGVATHVRHRSTDSVAAGGPSPPPPPRRRVPPRHRPRGDGWGSMAPPARAAPLVGAGRAVAGGGNDVAIRPESVLR